MRERENGSEREVDIPLIGSLKEGEKASMFKIDEKASIGRKKIILSQIWGKKHPTLNGENFFGCNLLLGFYKKENIEKS